MALGLVVGWKMRSRMSSATFPERAISDWIRGSEAYFAASTAGAKEGVARRGAHSCGVPASWSRGQRGVPGPLTPASAPQAPARLGREDARSLRSWSLQAEYPNSRARSLQVRPD